MRSGTSLFSAAIFRKNLTRFYLLVLLYTVLQCLALPFALSSVLGTVSADTDFGELMKLAVRTVYSSTVTTAWIAFLGACVSAMAVFSYLYSARSTNMIAALPIRREAVFISSVLAIFAVVLAANLLAVVLAMLVTAPFGLALGKWLIQWLLISCGQFLVFFGMAALCAVITGNILAMPAVYLVLNLIAYIFTIVLSALLSEVIYGVNISPPDWLLQLSPIVYLSSGPNYVYELPRDIATYSDISFANSGILCVYATAGAVMLAAAFFIHRARRMETAGDVVSVRPLRPVFRVLMSVVCGYFIGLMFYSVFLSGFDAGGRALRITACCAVFSFIGYVLADMAIRKSSRPQLRRSALPALVCAACVGGSIVVADIDVFGVEKYVPDAAEVKTVIMSRGFESSDPEDIEAVIELHRQLIDDKELNETDGLPYITYTYIEYLLDNGDIVRRSYHLCSRDVTEPTEAMVMLDRIQNSPEAIVRRTEPTEVEVSAENMDYCSINIDYVDADGNTRTDIVDLTSAEAWDLYTQCVLPDLQDGSMELEDFGVPHDVFSYNITLSFQLSEHLPAGSAPDDRVETTVAAPEYAAYDADEDIIIEYISVTPTNLSVRTNAWLTAHGVDLDQCSVRGWNGAISTAERAALTLDPGSADINNPSSFG